MKRIPIFVLYAFVCICAYADTSEYLKKISDSIKIQVQRQPVDSLFALTVKNLNLDDDILLNESAFDRNVFLILSIGTIDKKQQESVRVYGGGTGTCILYLSPRTKLYTKTLKPKYLIRQATEDFLRVVKEILCDPNVEKICYIDVTFYFSNLLKSDKIDLGRTFIGSEKIRLEGEELNAWIELARSLPPST